MKELITLIVCMVLIAANTFGQSSKTIRTYGIKKKTEVVIVFGDDVELARYVEEIELYNDEGDWVEKREYDEGGNLKSHKERIYEKDEVVEEIEIDANGSGMKAAKPPSFERRQFKYDRGDLIQEISLDRDGKTLKITEYRYNKFGDLEEKIEKDKSGNILETERTEYDERGLKVKETVFNEKEKKILEKLFVYE